MKTIASLLVGISIVSVSRIETPQGNIIRLMLETESEDHLGSNVSIPEEVLSDYEESIRALYYRTDPPFDIKTDIGREEFAEPIAEEIGEPKGNA